MNHTVYNNAQLTAALNAASPGDQILLHPSSVPYDVTITAYVNNVENITIKSANPNNMATIGGVKLYDAKGITFDGVRFGENPDPQSDFTVLVRTSENITIRNSVAEGTATGPLTVGGSTQMAGEFANIKYVDGFTFENNEVSKYNFGLLILESTDVDFRGNDIHSLQADPLRVGGVKDVYIENNYLHDLYGSDAQITHMDMIQVWSTDTQRVNENIYIRENVLDAGDGAGTQSILMRNERYEKSPSTALMYKNIVITDNVIYNGQYHGISVGETNGLQISNNTLVTHPDAVVRNVGWIEQSDPAISVSSPSYNVNVHNNIAGRYDLPGNVNQGNNITVNYDDPLSEYYVKNLFVNPFSDDMNVLVDLQAPPGGLLDQRNAGSSLTEFDYSPDTIYGLVLSNDGLGLSLNTHSFDVSNVYGPTGPLNTNGATVAWNFGDGHGTSGSTAASHFYEEPGIFTVRALITLANGTQVTAKKTVEVETPVAIAANFSNGATDISANANSVTKTSNVQFVYDGPHQVAKLNGGHVTYYRDEEYKNNTGFTVIADFRKDQIWDKGELFLFAGSFSMTVQEHTLRASITTDKGVTWMSPQWLDIDDTSWHRVILSFDGQSQSAAIYLDGQKVATASNVGSLHYGLDGVDLYLGSPYGPSFSGLIDNFSFLRGGLDDALAAQIGAPSYTTDALTQSYLSGVPLSGTGSGTQTPPPVTLPIEQPDGDGTLSGRYFVDANQDNRESSGEAGVAGVTVRAMQGGQVVATTTTDSNGNYSFTNLDDGFYSVRFSADPSGRDFVRTNVGTNDAIDSDVWRTNADGSGDTGAVQVRSGQNTANVDAGVEGTSGTPTSPPPPPPPPPPASSDNGKLSGRYFVDSDGDFREDGNEPGVAGVTVQALQRGQVVASTTTDANGNYAFNNLTNGQYAVRFGADPAGRDFTRTGVGSNDSIDSDVWRTNSDGSGETGYYWVTSTSGQSHVDAGVVAGSSTAPPPPPSTGSNNGGTLAGRYFADSNDNYLEDGGEPGLPGVTVSAVRNGQVVATTKTDTNGNYAFRNLEEGYYTVRFGKDFAGREFTRGNMGNNDAVDSDVWRTLGDGTGETGSFLITPTQSMWHADAGVAPREGSSSAPAQSSSGSMLGGRYFVDANNNFLEDSGEAGLPGVTIQLMQGSRVVASTKTDGNGNYRFTNLDDGYYSVRFGKDFAGREFTRGNMGSNDAVDSDVWKTNWNGTGDTGSFLVTTSRSAWNVDAGVAAPVAQVRAVTALASDEAAASEAEAAEAPVVRSMTSSMARSVQGVIEKSEITFDLENGQIGVDRDKDGTADETIALSGTFENGDFMAVYTDDETIFTFNDFLPGLSERKSVSDVNGIENEMFLTGSSVVSDYEVTLMAADQGAKYRNSLGVYEIREDGSLQDVRIIAENVKTASGPITVTDVEAGSKLGFFIIQDGYGRLDNGILKSGDLSLVVSDGQIRLADSGSTVQNARVFVSHDASLNPDGLEHVVSGISPDDGDGLKIGFEDQMRNSSKSDDDFQDVVFFVEAIAEIA